MKITIDTKEDSKEDIKKIISLLQKFTEETSEPESKPEMFSMFDNENVPEINADEETDLEDKKSEKEEFNLKKMLEEY